MHILLTDVTAIHTSYLQLLDHGHLPQEMDIVRGVKNITTNSLMQTQSYSKDLEILLPISASLPLVHPLLLHRRH
jgi:hypothetical protein